MAWSEPWLPLDGTQQQEFTPHSRNVVCLAWADGDSMLLSGSDDFTGRCGSSLDNPMHCSTILHNTVAVTPLDESVAPTSFQLDSPVYSLDWTDGLVRVYTCAVHEVAAMHLICQQSVACAHWMLLG